MISKESFVAHMKLLKELYDKDAYQTSFFQNEFECCPTTCFDHLLDDYIDLLEETMNVKDNWISYYIFELDFGDGYVDGMIKDKDGSNIKLSTPEELYDLICEDNKLIKEDAMNAKVVMCIDNVDDVSTYAIMKNNQIISGKSNISPEPIWFPASDDESMSSRICFNLNNVAVIDVYDGRDLSEYGFASMICDDGHKRWFRIK